MKQPNKFRPTIKDPDVVHAVFFWAKSLDMDPSLIVNKALRTMMQKTGECSKGAALETITGEKQDG